MNRHQSILPLIAAALVVLMVSGHAPATARYMSKIGDPASTTDTASGPSGTQTVGTGFGTVSAHSRSWVSDDGRYAVFLSLATNLVPGQTDTNNAQDVFLLDTVSGDVSLVSHSGDGVTAGDGESENPVISADGRYVTFVSRATDLVPAQSASIINALNHVFVFDRVANTIALVSHAGDNVTTANSSSTEPAISADGGFIAFRSGATNLVSGSGSQPNVFLFERATANLSVVSHTGDGVTGGNDDSQAPVISANGEFVAFESRASNLVPGQTENEISPGVFQTTTDVFLFDRMTNSISLVSHIGDDVTVGDDNSTNPVISGDGGHVAFESNAGNLVSGFIDGNGSVFSDVFLFSRAGGSISLVSHTGDGVTSGDSESDQPQIAANAGGLLVFESGANNLLPGQMNGNLSTDIFLYEPGGGVLSLVSHTGDDLTTGDDRSIDPVISADGSTVAFASEAADLIPGFVQNNGDSDTDIFVYTVAGGDLDLASHAGDGVNGGEAESSDPVIAGDGSRVLYTSEASDLEAGTSDNNGTEDVLDYDVGLDLNRYASRIDPNSGPATPGSPSKVPDGRLQGVSADGRFAVFTSSAPNLLPGQIDSNAAEDVFLYDGQTDSLRLVSHTGDGLTTGDAASIDPVLSGAGGHVAFVSEATNLVAGQVEDNFGNDVFLYERAGGNVSLVSHAGDNLTTGDNRSRDPVISANGRFVAFESRAFQMISGQSDGNNEEDVFLYDRQSGNVVLVSRIPASATTTGEDGAEEPAISADGEFVAFSSFADDLVPGSGGNSNVFLYERAAATLRVVSHTGDGLTGGDGNSARAVLSDDGGFVAFESTAEDLVGGQINSNSSFDVFLFERSSGDVTLLSNTGDGVTTGSRGSIDPVISGNGDLVAFESEAVDLIPDFDDNNGDFDSDVFVYDRLVGSLQLVSRAGESSSGGNDDSYKPALSADGGFVAFESQAIDLVAGQSDSNFSSDIFLFETKTGTVSLISHSGDGVTTSNSGSTDPNLAHDGSALTFSSRSTNLDTTVADGNDDNDAFYFRIREFEILFASSFEANEGGQ